jgi:hypothetical protein
VHLLHPRSLDHLAHIVPPNSAPSHNRDPVARLLYQFGDNANSFQRRGFPTRSQDAPNANVYQLLERLRRISHHIECAVEGDREATCRFNERARFRHGDATFRRQGTRHDSIDAEVASCLDIFEDCLDFFHRVDEVTGARPHQHEERNSDFSGKR